MRKSTWARMCP